MRRLTISSLLLVQLVTGISGCALLRRPQPVVDRTHDPRIEEEVRARLAREPGIDASRIRVEVEGGVVVLHGSVDGIQGWQCAIRNAGMVEGVRSVTDFLVIERATTERPCRAERTATVPDT